MTLELRDAEKLWSEVAGDFGRSSGSLKGPPRSAPLGVSLANSFFFCFFKSNPNKKGNQRAALLTASFRMETDNVAEVCERAKKNSSEAEARPGMLLLWSERSFGSGKDFVTAEGKNPLVYEVYFFVWGGGRGLGCEERIN